MDPKSVWDKLDPEEVKELQDYLRNTYGIPAGTLPWKKGTYSRVYKLTDDKLLRLTCLTRRGREIVNNARTVYDRAGNLMPKIDHMQAFSLPQSGAVIMETVMERIDNIPATEWKTFFHSPADLLFSLLEAGYDLEARGIIHRDISHNNVLLGAGGEFSFIDADDACVPDNNSSGMCSRSISGTSGYRLVEFDKNDSALAQLMIGGFSEAAQEGIDPSTRLARGVSAKNIVYPYPEQRAEHNMVHALVILAFVAITGAGNADVFFANYVRKRYPHIPRSWKLLLRRVCSADPNQRLDIEEALRFPIKNVDYQYFALQEKRTRRPSMAAAGPTQHI